jgi:hypothetical protein
MIGSLALTGETVLAGGRVSRRSFIDSDKANSMAPCVNGALPRFTSYPSQHPATVGME